jgi:hypothetical protein
VTSLLLIVGWASMKSGEATPDVTMTGLETATAPVAGAVMPAAEPVTVAVAIDVIGTATVGKRIGIGIGIGIGIVNPPELSTLVQKSLSPDCRAAQADASFAASVPPV